MILKITSSAVSPGQPETTPGPATGCYYVWIHCIPEGVSTGQVILLFTYTTKKVVDRGKRYEFHFSELCPSVF